MEMVRLPLKNRWFWLPQILLDMSPGPLEKTSEFDAQRQLEIFPGDLKKYPGVWLELSQVRNLTASLLFITSAPDLKSADKHPTWMWYNTFGCVLGLQEQKLLTLYIEAIGLQLDYYFSEHLPVYRLLFRSICLSFGHPIGKQKVVRASAKFETNCAYVIYLGWWGHFHLLKSFWCPAHWSTLYPATIYGSTSDIDTENHLFLIDFLRLKAHV